MRKLGYLVAALGAIVVAVPSMASAETVIIKKGGYGHHHPHYGARAEYRHDRGWHRGWRHGHGHGDRTVIIKKHRY